MSSSCTKTACVLWIVRSGSPKRGRYGPSKWLYLGVRNRSQGCWLTLTAGATPARGSRWRVETALALRRETLARPGCRKKGRRGKTQYDPGRSRGSGVIVHEGFRLSILLGSRFCGSSGSILAKGDGLSLGSIHISRVPVCSWFLSRIGYPSPCHLADSSFRVSRDCCCYRLHVSRR